MKYAYIDFEFNSTTHPVLNLVCCVILVDGVEERYWLHNSEKEDLAKRLEHLSKGYIFICYQAIAEARCMLDLGLPAEKYSIIDLYLEYRCLTNHHHKLQYGKQLVDGKVKMTFPPKPKWEREEGEAAGSFKATHSLAEAAYKLTGKIVDTTRKTEVRDLIISNPDEFSPEERKEIMDYCADDVLVLPEMWKAIVQEWKSRLKDTSKVKGEMLLRGEYAARTAKMEKLGYPIDVVATRRFSEAREGILFDLQQDINSQFPGTFRYKKATGTFSWNQNKTKEWIRSLPKEMQDGWMRTPTKDFSLSLDAFTRFFDFKHDYPRNNFGAQIVRFLKLKQAVYGFSKTGKAKSFWDYVGPDGMVRPYFNIYGAQSSRSQPPSSGYLFLKPAWMRSLCVPPPGKAIASIDYGSEEFFISALLSGDKNMIDAYLSGDVYLYFAKLAGAVPWDGTKKQYKKERDLFKATTLGISYLMSKYGLAIKLSQDTGEVFTEDDAQELIDKFYDAYPDFAEWQENFIEEYEERGYVKLPCGWYMWGDNNNFRSVANVPIQGLGASIMRKAVALAQDAGLHVTITLHDALYILFDSSDLSSVDILNRCMREAFVSFFPGQEKVASQIKMDPAIWSPDYPEEEVEVESPGGLKVKRSKIYIDERAEKDYKKFSKYFLTEPDTSIL